MGSGSAISQVAWGVVANVASLFLVTAVAVILLLVLSRRRRLMFTFFASGRHWSGKIRVMMSNIYVNVPEGSPSPQTDLGFSGATLTLGEQIYANKFVEAVEGRPATRLLRALADQIGLEEALGSVRCKLSVSPLRVDNVDYSQYAPQGDDGEIGRELAEVLRNGDTLVLVGGVVFNTLTRYVMGRSGDQSWFTFVSKDSEGAAIRALRAEANGSDATFTCSQRGGDGLETFVEYFFVQKVTGFGPDRSTIFICAGTSTAATVAALEKLTDWEALHQRFGDGAFAALYSLETSKRKPWLLGDEVKPDEWRTDLCWTPPERAGHKNPGSTTR